MKRTRIVIVSLFTLSLLVLACGIGGGVEDSVPTATSANTLPASTPAPSVAPSPAPTKTPQPTATSQPQATPIPTPTVEPAPGTFVLHGPVVSYNGITFDLDPSLGDTVYASTPSEDLPGYTRFAFAPGEYCREVGCVEVYAVQEYEEAFPVLPLPPVGAATILRAQDQHLDFQDGAGTRSIRMYGQDVFWANNDAIVYDYQGFTEDKQYYVLVTFPVDAPILLSAFEPKENTNEEAIPVPDPLPDDPAQLDDAIQEYNQEVERQLDLLAATDFVPDLAVLDALVASLQIEPSTVVSVEPGTFTMVAVIPPELLGEVIDLRADPGGALWVVATYGYARWRGGDWSVQATDRSRILVGVDDTRKMWILNEDGSKIFTWDGGPEYFPAWAGWSPVSDPAKMEGRGVFTDANGRVWLATDQDVRAFDGAEWAVFAAEDMGMASPSDADILTLFTLEVIGEPGQIWVGGCDWVGSAPVGGGGARWFDGKKWQGADSPVVSGCVTAIQEDSLGRVWVGVDADLWRFDPASGEWTRFAPPLPLERYRFSSISEIALDPAGEPWPLFAVCSGASCEGGSARYRWQDGAWAPVGEIRSGMPQTLVFDGSGTPWLVGGGVYRVEANQPVEPPVALIASQAVTVDDDGRVWVAGWQVGITGTQPATDMALWVFDPD